MHIGCYRMTQEDIEQVIKDQLELWAASEEAPKERERERERARERKRKRKRERKGD